MADIQCTKCEALIKGAAHVDNGKVYHAVCYTKKRWTVTKTAVVEAMDAQEAKRHATAAGVWDTTTSWSEL